MKKSAYISFIALFLSVISKAQPTSAILELEGNNQGFLPPVMTQTQMASIESPAIGLMVFCSDCNCMGPHFYSGATWVGPDNVPFDLTSTDVYNPATGKVWMDRNLGASQVASSSTDEDAYGDLYQWGRAGDGHQIRTSSTTTSLSGTNDPGHPDYILAEDPPYDWRSPQNEILWQGSSAINNPCPTGYRLPTEVEWAEERLSWSSDDSDGAYNSPLKLPLGGLRGNLGDLNLVGTVGNYWSSTVVSNFSRHLGIGTANAFINSNYRAYGMSIRCIRE